MKWVDEVEKLHNRNEWLLFFRIPKLIVFFETFKSEKCDVARVHQEIGFLFQRDVATRQKLHEAIKVSCCESLCIITFIIITYSLLFQHLGPA